MTRAPIKVRELELLWPKDSAVYKLIQLAKAANETMQATALAAHFSEHDTHRELLDRLDTATVVEWRALQEFDFTETPCVYEAAWIGRCKNPAMPESSVCKLHAKERCWCGAQAVRECSIAVSLVCGAPLCAEHQCRYKGHAAPEDDDAEA